MLGSFIALNFAAYSLYRSTFVLLIEQLIIN